MKKSFILFLLLISHCWSFAQPHSQLLQIGGNCSELSYDLVYQRGSQVYIRMAYPEDEDCGQLLIAGQIMREIVETYVPSLVVILTIKLPELGEEPVFDEHWRQYLDEPKDDDIILYENGEWVSDYKPNPTDGWVRSYELEGEIFVGNYPWIYMVDTGYFFVLDETFVTSQDGVTEAHTSRWMYQENFGWFYSLGMHPVSISSHPLIYK